MFIYYSDSPGFITLELQNNPLEPIKGPFLSIHTLLYLDISNCELDYLNPDFFNNITSLQTLDLSGNPIKSISKDVFHPLTSLEVLKMNHCNLTDISATAFNSQGFLKTLELSANYLRDIEWRNVLQYLLRLDYLDLRQSGITGLQDDVFNNLTYLRTLILAENDLRDTDISGTIGEKLHQLETLDLSHCNLKKPLSEDAFSNANKLRTLYLSGNTLFASDLLVALAPLVKLHKLSLSHCELRRLPDTFDKFKSLQELDISYNPLNDAFVKLLAPLKKLEYLNMGYSNISYLAPSSFSKMTSMKRLVLSGNRLNNLEAGLFGNLTHLESLELNSCGLKKPFNATVFFNNLPYTDLKELQLAGNPLVTTSNTSLLPKQLSRLEKLDLSNCNTSYLPIDAFINTPNIKELILNNNRFKSSDLTFLEKLQSLEVLDMRHNNLSSFSPSIISANSAISKIKLVGNPWICDCNVAELWDWAALHKGDISILEGSTLAQEDVSVGKQKRKKLLTCNYDVKIQPIPIVVNKTAAGRRPFSKANRTLTQTNRTWAKYVRESGCEQLINLRDKRFIKTFEDELTKNAVHDENKWMPAALKALTIYFIILIVLSILYITIKLNLTKVNKKDMKFK